MASRGGNGGALRALGGYEFDFGADCVAIAFVGDELQGEPVILRGSFVVENVDGAIVGGDDGVEAAVVVDVTDGHAAAQPRLAEDDAGGGGNVDELFARVAEEEHGFAEVAIGITQLDGVEVVALSDEEILPEIGRAS